MTQGTGISAEALRARLQERLSPTQLEVLDESAAHVGHVGQDGTGAGTHFRVRIASPLFAGNWLPRYAIRMCRRVLAFTFSFSYAALIF